MTLHSLRMIFKDLRDWVLERTHTTPELPKLPELP